ncbi:hypothetical protein OESDEN_13824 [Oesophagostomum dentatum]|uniref:Uncharacterized protein n=1 Tax=Oesophagostomum dentatum TaxID=61180 RepID=A0A0B1ST77_OESDE|nr:hypothetical protein OESDEN_13824 [Oesophagostomum dentatum]
MTEFHCNSVQYLSDEDPSDVTTSVQQTIRRAFLFMIIGGILDIIGLVTSSICCILPRPYSSLFASTIVHINAGKSSFLLTELAALFSIVVYMAKRDERTFNRYKIRSLLNFSSRSMSDDKTDSELLQDSYNNQPTRFKRRRAGISSPVMSDIASFDEIASPKRSFATRSADMDYVPPYPGLLFLPGFGEVRILS